MKCGWIAKEVGHKLRDTELKTFCVDEVFVGPMNGLEISRRDAQGCREAGC